MRPWSVLSAALLLTAALPVLAAGDAPAQHGVEAGDIDRTADPCTDFFQFANGAWRAKNPIPASQPRWSRRWAAGDQSKDRLKAILDEVSAHTDWRRGSVEQLIGDFYGSCMDQAAADRAGLAPVKPLLDRIDAMSSPADLTGTIRQLHDVGVAVPFVVFSSPDNHEPRRTIAYVAAGGLGLPDRDYYVKTEPRFVEARDKYKTHVAAIFRLAGRDEARAAAAADTVFRIEKQLAEASLDNVALRDPSATDHVMSFDAFTKLAPGIRWAAYFDAAHLPRTALNVTEPKFLQDLDRQVRETPLADWKTYLAWHVLRSASDALATPFVEESFRFNGAYLAGAKEMKPRWKRCVEQTDQLLGEALGRKYVERWFPPAAKARMQDLVKNLLAAMKDTITGLDWMSPETKTKALAKLATFNPKLGYPDKWKNYSRVPIRRDAYFANVLAASRFNVDDDRSRMGKPTDRGLWQITTPTSDAYYNPLLNEIVFPAGILQPPGFSVDATDAVNYGAIGVVIGHEISHGFDDQGAQYDAEGRLNNWWTAEDLARFKARGQCVVDQFEGYFIEPGIHHNGRLVLGEAIGDLAGAKIAYLAFLKSREGKPAAPPKDGLTLDQQFFVAWGQFRGDEIRPETQRLMVQSDPHPIAKFRVIGPLSNLPAFQKAFACKDGSAMVRPKETRCEVW